MRLKLYRFFKKGTEMEKRWSDCMQYQKSLQMNNFEFWKRVLLLFVTPGFDPYFTQKYKVSVNSFTFLMLKILIPLTLAGSRAHDEKFYSRRRKAMMIRKRSSLSYLDRATILHQSNPVLFFHPPLRLSDCEAENLTTTLFDWSKY